MRRRSSGGFTLIELLVTVAIIGILATIAILAYRSAITRARQKRTMTDMRTLATAWEARATDTQSYLVAGAGFSFPVTPVTGLSLRAALSPTYLRDFPAYDGWARPYDFGASENDTVKNYGIRSMGRDGAWEGSYVEGLTSSPDCDIVYSNGAFVASPAAVQSN